MKKILILSNSGFIIRRFRKELIESIVNKGDEVYTSFPVNDPINQAEDFNILKKLSCNIINTPIDRRGINPLKDMLLLLNYIKLIVGIKPDIVLTYTIKPNIYGGLACILTGTKYIANVTGLGTALEKEGVLKKILLVLYKVSLSKVFRVFFQNKSEMSFFVSNKIAQNKTRLIPGSGVNLNEFGFEEYPEKNQIGFLYMGRIMQEKGVMEFLEAARLVKQHYSDVEFDLIGTMEDDMKAVLSEYQQQGIVNYFGMKYDVKGVVKQLHAVVLPSYHEGMSNSLLEAAAIGRPVLASRIPGCMETFDEGVSGIGFEAKNANSLAQAITEFINLPYEIKKNMGYNARKKVESEFDRRIVVDAYLEEINYALS